MSTTKEFDHNLRLSAPVDDNLASIFSDLLNSNQSAMNRIAFEYQQAQTQINELTKENARLRAQNKQLTESAGEAGRGGGSARGAAEGEAEEAFAFQRSIEIHDAPVHSVCMSTRGEKIIATASWDATVKLYNLASSQIVGTLGDVDQREEGKMGGLYAVAFAKTAPEILGCASCDKSVYLWNHSTGTLCNKLSGHKDEVNGIDFHHEQQVMVTASDDCKAIIWDFQEGIMLRQLDKHTKAVYGCTFLGAELPYFVATCCFDQKTRIFDMRDKRVVTTLTGHSDDVIGIDYSSSKQCIATGSDDGGICIWDARTWQKQKTIDTRADVGIADNEVKRIAFSPDGGQLAAACSSGRVLVYNLAGASTAPAQLKGHTDCVFDVSWGMDSGTNRKILVSASHDHSCRYWREA